jgi:hypothetical protein
MGIFVFDEILNINKKKLLVRVRLFNDQILPSAVVLESS